MIKFKTGNCRMCPPGTGPKPLYARGLCQYHYWLDITKTAAAKKNSPTALVNQNSNLPDKQSLQYYFQHHVAHSIMVCENCGEPLYFWDVDTAYSCQAHIIPKALFPSVKANIYNHLSLGGLFQRCSCHTNYDTSWARAERMPVFEIAKQRFLLFKDEIDPGEIRKLPEQFYRLL